MIVCVCVCVCVDVHYMPVSTLYGCVYVCEEHMHIAGFGCRVCEQWNDLKSLLIDKN